MAVITVAGEPVVGIKYSATTASNIDWSGVSNSTYFYDLTDKLVHYKDSSGNILEIFSSGGGGTSFTGGTVAGATNFTNGLTANTISATTYFNLPQDVYVTGFTYSNNLFTLKRNASQPDLSVLVNTMSGLTVNGDLIVSGNTQSWFSGDSSSDLVKITQTGSGNAFVVEDSNNPDFTQFVINNGGDVGIGTNTPAAKLHISNTATTINAGLYTSDFVIVTAENTAPGFNIISAGNSFGNRGVFKATRSRGTLSSPLVPQSGDFTFSLLGAVYDGVTNLSTAGVSFEVDGSVTANTAPQRITFLTGTGSTRFERLRVTSSGDIGIGTDTPVAKLHVSGNTLINGNLTANTISATTYFNLPSLSGDYLPLSGGTVYGPTIYTNGLTANTLNVTGLTQTSGITSTGGIIFPHKTITGSYTATTADYFLNVSGGTLDIFLMTAVAVQGKLLVIKNEGSGIVNVISQLGELIDDRNDVLLTKGNSVQLVSDGVNWVILGYNISSTQANTGVIEFSGLSKVTSSTFSVSRVKGFIVDDATNPTIPFLTYVEYTGGTHTALYVSSSTETYVYITSGGTIQQTVTPLTEKERRQNIFLGKLGHADKTSIINAFSQPDFVLTPLSQLRDMFQPIGFVNGGIVPYANAANLTFATTANYLYGLGINFSTDILNPNQLYVSGNTTTTFQYRTQTGGTSTNITNINPLNYDLNGVITPLSGTKATNQRIYLVQNGIFRIQYGQTSYSNFAAAVAGISTETFNTFSNFRDNAILIGILTVLSTASDLTDTSKAQFFLASKFGETIGTAGGVSTTNLQQAYNNSTNPEIVINATLDGLTIKNGTGNADNITHLLEGQTASNGVTSFIRADGDISGTTFQTNGFIANTDGMTATTVSATTLITPSFRANNGGITATTVSATTYYNLPKTTLQQAYTASTSPEFTINSTQLGVQFRNDTGDDNTPMIVVQNNAGATKGEWRADGTLYAAGLYSTGDVVITGNTNISGTTTVGGDVNTLGYLRSYNSTGDEGGEIFLNKAAANTTLVGGVTIDVWQNRLRFFEQGGTARGAYIDLTAAGAGVSTNLLSGGGEINTASNLSGGTGLFAQKVSTDLQFKSLSSTGGTITISNNSTTVNLEVVPVSNFTGGLSANTISATTYYNLPIDVSVTGGTYSNGSTIFTNTTGGTFTVTGFKTDDVFVTGGTYSNGSLSFTNNTGGTFNVNTSTNYAAGVISGATYSSAGSGQINLPAIKVALYNNANHIEPILVYDVAAGTTGTGGIPSLVDQDTNYVVVEYNGGSPRYYVYDNDGVVNDSSTVLFMIAYRDSNFVHTLEFGNQGAGLANKLNDRFNMTDRFGWESGLSLSLSASTGIVMATAGVAWNGPNRQSLTAVDSSGSTFFQNYHTGGTWTYTTSADTLNNTYYDNGTDIVSATAGKYLTNWYFRGQEINSHLYEVFSTTQYDSVALAQLATEPSLPELITSHAILLGRVVVQVGASTGVTESAFSTVFQSTQVTSHNDLTGLQGGTAGQYYHLTSNQYNNLAFNNVNNNFTTGQTITGNLTVTGGTQSIFSGNSSTDLVRITQTGSGNAFVVEDSATNDGNKFIIDNDGNVSIGLNTPYYPSKLYIAAASTNTNAIRATVGNTGTINPIAIKGDTQGDGTNTIIGLYGSAINGNIAIGVAGYVSEDEFGSTTLGIGGQFGSFGSGTNYSVQLQDGTQGIGKVLISKTSDGKANWSSTLSGLTTVQATTLIGDGSQITNVPAPYGIINAIASGNYLI